MVHQGNIFAVQHSRSSIAATPPAPGIKDENTEAARRILRFCDSLFDTFLQELQSVFEGNRHLFEEGIGDGATLLLADDAACKINLQLRRISAATHPQDVEK